MAGPNIQGSFTTGSAASTGGAASDVCCIPTGKTTMRLTVTGLDGSNTVKTQKRTAGGAWADQTTYNSDQSNVAVTVAAGEEWRLAQITQQAVREIRFVLNAL